MATEIITRRLSTDRGPALVPATAHDAEELGAIPYGVDLRSVIKRARNIKRHNLYYAIVQFIWEHQSRYSCKDEIDQVIRVSVGHCYVSVKSDGVVINTPKPLNFGAMDETEFSAFFKRVVDFVANEILPGVTSQQIHDELAGLIGIERAA